MGGPFRAGKGDCENPGVSPPAILGGPVGAAKHKVARESNEIISMRFDMAATATKAGKIVQVIGSTFDVEFADHNLPDIYNALEIRDKAKGGVNIHLTGEVQQHLGGNRVRCVALGSTDGLVRGMMVNDTGSPVTVPVGEATLGRVF